jgi:hypothetical protein
MSWLLKDLGWMTTNVYLAWPFGILSIFLHILVLVIDWSSSIANRFYHTSLVLWIVGNFLWMSVEFMVTPQSSSIHLGPDTPLGGMSQETGDKLTNIKSKLFLLAIFLQLTLFICIRCNIIQMPHDSDSELGDDEDMLWKDDDEEMLRRLEEASSSQQQQDSEQEQQQDSEQQPLVDQPVSTSDNSSSSSSSSSSNSTHHSHPRRSTAPGPVASVSAASRSVSDSSSVDDSSVLDSFRRFIPTTKKYPLGFSLTFIENGYIILWICKDYFWSWATGDFPIEHRNVGYFTGK